ncbi:hypothetical protein ACXZ1M_20345 [Duganella sp. PWIR1]
MDDKKPQDSKEGGEYLAATLTQMTGYPPEFWIALNALVSPEHFPRSHYEGQLGKLREFGLCEQGSERATPAAAFAASLGRALLWSEMERRIAMRAGIEGGMLMM